MADTFHNIKQARLSANLTQKELAEKMGIVYQTIQKWEKGTRIMSVENALKLTAALGISVDKLLKG